jgi:pyridoxamine 5'-phosphate oxidase
MQIADLRQDYKAKTMEYADMNPNPIQQFNNWFDEALASKLLEPNAMTLATVSSEGKPSARVVLLKGLNADGFIFFTNYESRKGQNIDTNPNVALVFLWLELERQVRIEGVIEKISAEESEVYFHSRPHSSQLGAWVSPQSKVIEDRGVLEQTYLDLEREYKSKPIPKPENWGGYRVKPNLIEFWQGRSSRLHDRMCYQVQEDGNWQIVRLAP